MPIKDMALDANLQPLITDAILAKSIEDPKKREETLAVIITAFILLIKSQQATSYAHNTESLLCAIIQSGNDDVLKGVYAAPNVKNTIDEFFSNAQHNNATHKEIIDTFAKVAHINSIKILADLAIKNYLEFKDLDKPLLIYYYQQNNFDLLKENLTQNANIDAVEAYREDLIKRANRNELGVHEDKMLYDPSLKKLFPEIIDLENLFSDDDKNRYLNTHLPSVEHLRAAQKVLKRIDEIKQTDYGSETDKLNKIAELTKLVDALLSKPLHNGKKDSVTEAVLEWEGNNQTSYAHRRTFENFGVLKHALTFFQSFTNTKTESLIESLKDKNEEKRIKNTNPSVTR